MPSSYKKPPIVEAVIETRFSSALSEKDVRDFMRKNGPRFGHVEEQEQVEFTFGQTQSISRTFAGARMVSADASEVVVITTQSIVVARNAPYTGWTALKERALAELSSLRKLGATRRVSRLGVRYINRIDVPNNSDKQFSPEPYLTVFPGRPALLRQAPAEGYNLALTGCQVGGYTVNINTGTVPPALIDHGAILVDIDSYVTGDMDIPAITARLDEVHDIKNAVFESLITDEARKLFQ